MSNQEERPVVSSSYELETVHLKAYLIYLGHGTEKDMVGYTATVGNKIHAIKYLREQLSLTLSEAKGLIEAIIEIRGAATPTQVITTAAPAMTDYDILEHAERLVGRTSDQYEDALRFALANTSASDPAKRFARLTRMANQVEHLRKSQHLVWEAKVTLNKSQQDILDDFFPDEAKWRQQRERM